MPRVLVYANCQVGPIHRMIERAAPRLEVVRTLPVHTVKPSGVADVQELIQSADIVLGQPIGAEFGVLSSESLNSLPGQREWITFPSIYFSGLFPHLFYLRQADRTPLRGPLTDYHDRRIAASFLEGLEVDECVRRMQHANTDACRKHFDLAMAESQRREQELPIKVMDYVGEHVLEQRLFHTYNHPDNGVMWHVVRQFLRLIGEPMVVDAPPVNQYLNEVSAAIPDDLGTAMGLRFRDNVYKLRGQAIAINQLVESFFRLYETTPDFQGLCERNEAAGRC